MKCTALALALAAPLALGACTPQQVSGTVSTVCADVAAISPQARAILDAQDPHSAAGVLWADTKSACVNGTIAVGVDPTWGGMIVGELKALIPQVLPMLIPLLIGFL